LSTSSAMNRPPAVSSLGASVALLVTLLHLVSALHFALVPHGYSLALGGVVHLHRASQRTPEQMPQAGARASALSADSRSCTPDRCPAADAPHGSVPRVELLAAGLVAFGDVRLLTDRGAHAHPSRRVFLSAPKTSPPT
jgi:hypothetical protein